MTRHLIAVEVDGSIFAIRGWKAHGLALGAGLRPTYSGVRGAWIADTKRLPELLAYLQHRNIPAEIDDVTPTAIAEDHGADRAEDHGDGAISTDEPLFELDGGR
jgi:hypothetical protein